MSTEEIALPEWMDAEVEVAQQECPHLTLDQCRLYALMSDISEDCYCAGWMSGNEYRLWAAVTNADDDRDYGQGTITDQQITWLQNLAERAGGWIYWRDDRREPGLPLGEWGPAYMPIDAWRAHFATSDEARHYRPATPSAGA